MLALIFLRQGLLDGKDPTHPHVNYEAKAMAYEAGGGLDLNPIAANLEQGKPIEQKSFQGV